MAQHIEFGKEGEDSAVRFLIDKGYKIIDRNWRFGKHEIDIIAREGTWIVIVEVKKRRTAYFGEPEDAVNRKKRKRLVLAADAYVNIKNLSGEVRYDIISIVKEGEREIIRHIKDAFYPTL